MEEKKPKPTPMDAASAAVQARYPFPPKLDDPRLIIVKQLLRLARQSLDAAIMAEDFAHRSKMTAETIYRELEVRMELLETDIGLRDEHGLLADEEEGEEHA